MFVDQKHMINLDFMNRTQAKSGLNLFPHRLGSQNLTHTSPLVLVSPQMKSLIYQVRPRFWHPPPPIVDSYIHLSVPDLVHFLTLKSMNVGLSSAQGRSSCAICELIRIVILSITALNVNAILCRRRDTLCPSNLIWQRLRSHIFFIQFPSLQHIQQPQMIRVQLPCIGQGIGILYPCFLNTPS